MLAAAVAVLAPALIHGASLGLFDLHNAIPYDQMLQYIPWTSLAWTQVHHGYLPLWNPYSALGMPLAFNWQSATFSVPMLLGYLVPLRFAYTAQVLVTLAIAGTGVYVLGRVLRLGVIGCVFAATVYELSGPFMGWLGWPQASTFSWTGWIFAAALLVIRGGERARHIALFAVVLACTIYAGFPEGLALLGLALGVFLIVLLGLRVPRLGGSGPILRPVVDLGVGAVAGAALGAPLALPGLQLSSGSSRDAPSSLPGFHVALPVHDIVNVVFQGFYGLPSSQWFDSPYHRLYPETAAYVGVIAVVLAGMALAIRRTRPEVIAFGAVVVATAAVVFAPPVTSLMNGLPYVGSVLWTRAKTPMAFAVAVLAGVGMDMLARSHKERSVRSWMAAGFSVAALALVALWVLGRGHLPPGETAIRARSFIWPVIETALGLVVVAALAIVRRRNHRPRAARVHRRLDALRWAALSLLACETAFLIAAGVPLWSSTPSILARTPDEVALKRAVGSSVVGFGLPHALFNVNDVYGVQEFDVYDPMTPLSYFRSWYAATSEPAGLASEFKFIPAVQTATIARRYGVGFVLEPIGLPGPQGGVFDMKEGYYDLYRIPGAAVATLTPILPNQQLPSVDVAGTPILVTHSNPASWQLVTSSTTPQVLRLHLTDVPGWHGTIDGRPLPLHQFSGLMLQARIPPGRHKVELSYWPTAFTVGIVVAACSAAGLLSALFISRFRRRPAPRTRRSTT